MRVFLHIWVFVSASDINVRKSAGPAACLSSGSLRRKTPCFLASSFAMCLEHYLSSPLAEFWRQSPPGCCLRPLAPTPTRASRFRHPQHTSPLRSKLHLLRFTMRLAASLKHCLASLLAAFWRQSPLGCCLQPLAPTPTRTSRFRYP